jgi:hypothetical protein
MLEKIHGDATTIANLTLDLEDQKKSRANYQSRAMTLENEKLHWNQRLVGSDS